MINDDQTAMRSHQEDAALPSPQASLSKVEGVRSKTSLRIRYEAESQMILKKFGGLEGLRKSLSLSQRKICQILMVDPSSWSRWLKDEEKVPPHILRACEWYMALNDKYPGFDVNFWLHSQAKQSGLLIQQSLTMHEEILSESSSLKMQVNELQIQIQKLEKELRLNQIKNSDLSPNSNRSLESKASQRSIYQVAGFFLLGVVSTLILTFILKHLI